MNTVNKMIETHVYGPSNLYKCCFENEVAIVAIIKNEGAYIKEWLDYHIPAGVSKFYLYDNDSTDGLKKVLQPYIENEWVEYIYYPGKCMQLKAYNDALDRHRFDCRFMAFIDADEFIFPRTGSSIPETIETIISDVPKAGGVVINWRIFGSSRQKKKNLDMGVLERFLFRAKDDFSPNRHIKTIVNPRCVRYVAHVHYAAYLTGIYAVDEYGNPVIFSPFNERNTVDKIGINHYFTKSLEEWLEKRGRGTADTARIRPMNNFDQHDKNDIYDDGIINYWEQCKKQNYKLPNNGRNKNNIFSNRVSIALDLIKNAFEDNAFDWETVNAETILQCWYLCKKYNEKVFKEYDESMIVQYFIKVLKSKMDGISEYDALILHRYLPDFTCCKNDEEIYRRIIKVCECRGGIQRPRYASILKTFHNTYAFMSEVGEVIHRKKNDVNEEHMLIFSYPIAEHKYVFFVTLHDEIIYIKEFLQNGNVTLSMLPAVFDIEHNENGSISILQEEMFVTAINDGGFTLQNHNYNWEKFYLEDASIFSVQKLKWNRFVEDKDENIISKKQKLKYREIELKKDLLFDMCTARVDLRNCGSGCSVEVKNLLEGENVSIEYPEWFKNKLGQGAMVQCAGEKMKIFIRCIGSGMLNIDLRGVLRIGLDGKKIPYWITVISLLVNGKNMLSTPTDVWHDQPLICRKKVVDGENMILELNWQPCVKKVRNLLEI